MKRLHLVRLNAFFQRHQRPKDEHLRAAEEHRHAEHEHLHAAEEHRHAEYEHRHAEEEERYAEREHRRAEEERRRSAVLEAEVEVLTAALEARGPTEPGAGGTGANPPSKSSAAWVLLGLLLLGSLAATACAVGSKGGMPIINIPFLLAAIVAIVAVSLHVYTMEVWIWPKLRDIGFPATPFGDATITKGLYRIVWHFFTVAWLGTILLLLFFTFGDIIPYVNLIVNLLIIYWIGIVISIFIVAWLSLEPGESYIKTIIKAFQWVIVLIMVGLMYWGTKV